MAFMRSIVLEVAEIAMDSSVAVAAVAETTEDTEVVVALGAVTVDTGAAAVGAPEAEELLVVVVQTSRKLPWLSLPNGSHCELGLRFAECAAARSHLANPRRCHVWLAAGEL
jgi:hypothetical protein